MFLENSSDIEIILHAIQLLKHSFYGESFNEILFEKALSYTKKAELALLKIEKITWKVEFELNFSYPSEILKNLLNIGKELHFTSEAELKTLIRSLSPYTKIDIQDLNNSDTKHFTLVVFRCLSTQDDNTSLLIELIMPYLHIACIAAHRHKNKSKSPLNMLTSREREVLNWISSGKTNEEISMILGISPYTVKNHVANILGKLDVPNRSAATALIKEN